MMPPLPALNVAAARSNMGLAAILAVAVPCIALGIAFAPGAAFAQERPGDATGAPRCAERPFLYVRSEEDARDFADRSCDRDRIDRLRYFDFGTDGLVIGSIGGEIRLRYQLYDELDFGAIPPDDDGAFYERGYLFGDLRVADHVRLFGTLRTAAENASDDERTLADNAGTDIQEAFVEVGDLDGLSFRVGRQEISYPLAPPSRLLSAREGPNVRRSFDAVRVIGRFDAWRADAFYAGLVDLREGNFDDRSTGDVEFWGAYAFSPVRPGGEPTLSLYYYGLSDETPSFQNAKGRELRHTLGVQLKGDLDGVPLDYDVETAIQSGRIGSQEIVAGFAAADFGYTFDTPREWRLGGQLFAASGDGDPDDGTLSTFNQLFPSGSYLNDASLLRGQNLLSAGATLGLKPSERTAVSTFYTHYWRTDRGDGFYAQSGAVQREGSRADGREIGGYLGISGTYDINPRTDFTLRSGVFMPGTFIVNTGPDRSTSFLRTDLRVRF